MPAINEVWNGPKQSNNKENVQMRDLRAQFELDAAVEVALAKVNYKEEVIVPEIKEYEVRLRNNHPYMATSSDELVFMVQLANGVKAYSVNDIASFCCLQDDEEEVVINQMTAVNNKEDALEIFHFLKETKNKEDGMEVVRIITTDLSIGEYDAYRQSLADRKPVKTLDGKLLLAMSTGDWQFALLQYRLADKGRHFRVMAVDHTTLKNLGSAKENVDKSTFAWANASSAFFLRVEGEDDWGLDALGLLAFNTKKISKRNQEILRITAHHLYDESGQSISIREFIPRNASKKDVKLYDGINFIKRSLATKMGFAKRVHRINFRLMTENGVIKGDAIILPDKMMNVDVIYHGENLKDDLKTTGWMLATGFEHSPFHMAVWDDQSMINNQSILTEAHQMSDINTLVEGIREDVNNGVLPKWLLSGEEAHGEFGAPVMEKASQKMHINYARCLAEIGIVTPFQNFVYMGLNGTINRMLYSVKNEKMWLPMSNAFTGTVVTYEALTEMGNVRLPSFKKNLVFFDARYGVVIPGRRFIETFDLHGTHDQDDTEKIIVIKVWSSNNDITEIHRGGFTIPADMYIPATAEDAVLAVAVIRSPNGPGEFSIEMFDEASMMPLFHNLDMDNITVVDVKDMALPQSVLLDRVVRSGMKSTMVYDKTAAFSKKDALKMIRAQAINPRIGPMANLMMHWVNTFGPSFPDFMLDVFGELVDAVQQGADIEQFKAISAEAQSVFDQYVELVSATGAPIDRYLIASRMKSPEMSTRIPQNQIVSGRLDRVQAEYIKSIAVIKKEILQQSLQMRQSSELRNKIQTVMVGSDVKAWAEKFYALNIAKLSIVGDELKKDAGYQQLMGDKKDDGRKQARVFAELMMQQAKSEEASIIVHDMVSELLNFGDDMDRHVVGLYKYITTPTKRMSLGFSDRIICQSGARGELIVMDLLIAAMKNMSII